MPPPACSDQCRSAGGRGAPAAYARAGGRRAATRRTGISCKRRWRTLGFSGRRYEGASLSLKITKVLSHSVELPGFVTPHEYRRFEALGRRRIGDKDQDDRPCRWTRSRCPAAETSATFEPRAVSRTMSLAVRLIRVLSLVSRNGLSDHTSSSISTSPPLSASIRATKLFGEGNPEFRLRSVGHDRGQSGRASVLLRFTPVQHQAQPQGPHRRDPRGPCQLRCSREYDEEATARPRRSRLPSPRLDSTPHPLVANGAAGVGIGEPTLNHCRKGKLPNDLLDRGVLRVGPGSSGSTAP